MRVKVLLRALVIPKWQMRQVDLSSSSLCAVAEDSLLRLFTGSSSHAPLHFIPLSALVLLNVSCLDERFGRPRALIFFLKENRNRPSSVRLFPSISGAGNTGSPLLSCVAIGEGGHVLSDFIDAGLNQRG